MESDSFPNEINQQYAQAFSKIALKSVKLDSEKLIFSSSLANNSKNIIDINSVPYPFSLHDSLQIYANFQNEIKPKEDLVISMGKIGIAGGGIFSILNKRKMLIAKDIYDIFLYLSKIKPKTVMFALDNSIFTLNNSQKIRDFSIKYNIGIGFLYCYALNIATWHAIKI
jgi:hypothetical protein